LDGKGLSWEKGRRYLASIFYGYTIKTKYKNPTIIIIIIIIIFSLLTQKKKPLQNHFILNFFYFKKFPFGQNFTFFYKKKRLDFHPINFKAVLDGMDPTGLQPRYVQNKDEIPKKM